MLYLSNSTWTQCFRSTLLILEWWLKVLCCGIAETSDSVLVLKGPQGRINRAVWGPLNRTIISGGEDSVLRLWDAEVCVLIKGSFKIF